MFKNTLVPFALAVAFASGCSSIPTGDIEIKTEAAPKANFSGYKTYGWLGAATIVNDPAGQWKPQGFDADAEIKFLVDRELRARGMSESSDKPDLVIAFALGVDMANLELKTKPDTELEVLSNVPRGGFLVVMVDSASGFAIWAGVAQGHVMKEVDPEMAKGRLDYAVSKMINKMPK
jgi:hypothetical protein